MISWQPADVTQDPKKEKKRKDCMVYVKPGREAIGQLILLSLCQSLAQKIIAASAV